MSLRNEAREFALDAVRSAIGETYEAIDRRLQWRWDNAPLLAREAERMIYLLKNDPTRVAFRKARIGHWRRRHRRFAAKAWAQDPKFARACGVCVPALAAFV